MEIQGAICILCLERCESFKAVEGSIKNILDLLLLKIDFTIIQGPVVCKKCEELLMKCFDFKTTCLHTQNYIVPFLNNMENIKLDLKDVYLSKNVTGTDVEDRNICGFCMSLIKNCSAVSVDIEEGDVILEKMMEQCLPELDLSRIKKPVICASCHGSLKDCFHFMMNCLTVGEKIDKYCENPDVNSKGQIEVSSLLQLTTTNVTTRKIDVNSVDIIKLEEQFCEDRENPHETGDGTYTVKLEQIYFDDSEDANKDDEIRNTSFMKINDQEVNNEQQFTSKNILACAGESNKFDFIKREEIFYDENDESEHKEKNLVEMEDQTFLLKEEIEIKTEKCDVNRFEDDIVLLQSELSSSLLKRAKCSLPTFEKDQSNPVTMYKCDSCSFETKRKRSIRYHVLTHKDPAEIAMYKCHSCSFQARKKFSLVRHLLTHRDPSEVTMYKCDSCSFETKHKRSLTFHLLTHKDPAEITMYKCDFCSYQAKTKPPLTRHLLKHKDPSEVTMYKCDFCSFETKYKPGLKIHILSHKDPAEVTMYKCGSCSFQAKLKKQLKDHLLKHIDPSEITMYSCDLCPYQTRFKRVFEKHLLVHKDPSEVIMYKCLYCSYQTKHKSNLKSHMQTHKDRTREDPSKVAMYKCDYCSMQTKYKRALKRHLKLLHKENPSEVTSQVIS